MRCIYVRHGGSVEHPLGLTLTDESPNCLTIFKSQAPRRRDNIPLPAGGLGQEFRAQLAMSTEHHYSQQLQSLLSVSSEAYDNA